MQYRIEGGSLPALIINLNPGETIITGPGKVYLQTMTVANIAKLIIPFIPEKK